MFDNIQEEGSISMHPWSSQSAACVYGAVPFECSDSISGTGIQQNMCKIYTVIWFTSSINEHQYPKGKQIHNGHFRKICLVRLYIFAIVHITCIRILYVAVDLF